jgi:hypothetical protein
VNTVHQRRLVVVLVSTLLALAALVIAPSAEAQTGPATRYL